MSRCFSLFSDYLKLKEPQTSRVRKIASVFQVCVVRDVVPCLMRCSLILFVCT